MDNYIKLLDKKPFSGAGQILSRDDSRGPSCRVKKCCGKAERVIEKKEVWLNTSDDPETGDYRVIPAI